MAIPKRIEATVSTKGQIIIPAEFREDILEAAKQGTAEDYKEAVRRYYEELVK